MKRLKIEMCKSHSQKPKFDHIEKIIIYIINK